LLAKGVAKMAKVAGKVRGLGLATRTKLVNKTRTVRARARSINANLRRGSDDKIAEVKRINGDLAKIAERVAGQAEEVVRNARRKRTHAGQGRVSPGEGRGRSAAAGRHADTQDRRTDPVSVSPGRHLTVPLGWSRCTIPMRVRSPRAASASRSEFGYEGCAPARSRRAKRGASLR
jgi:hypothetical protein